MLLLTQVGATMKDIGLKAGGVAVASREGNWAERQGRFRELLALGLVGSNSNTAGGADPVLTFLQVFGSIERSNGQASRGGCTASPVLWSGVSSHPDPGWDSCELSWETILLSSRMCGEGTSVCVQR